MSFMNGTLVSQPNQAGFFQDWTIWVVRLFVTPILAGYYLWTSNSIGGLIEAFQKSNTVDLAEHDIITCLSVYHYPWRSILSLLAVPVMGVTFFVSRKDIASWSSTGIIPRLTGTFAVSIGTYMASMITLTLLLNAWTITRMLRNKTFSTHILHPDRCGGLQFLGDYSLKTAYLAAASGIVIGITEYRFVVRGLAQTYWLVPLIIPLYIIGSAMFFFAPLLTAHKKMKEAKDKILNNISNQFQNCYDRTQHELVGSAEILKQNIDKLEQIQKLYDLSKNCPTWPFDVVTFRKFLLSVASPIITIAVGLVSQFLTSRFIP